MNRVISAVVAAGLASVSLTIMKSDVAAAIASPQQTFSPSTVGQVYKNIQVLTDLKDHPSGELWSAMQFIAESLSVHCDYCHEQRNGPFDTDVKPAKQTARKMMRMVRSINDTTFGGRQVVTCATCHKGSTHPSGVTTPWYKTPEEIAALAAASKGPAREAPATALPTVDQIMAAYRKAVGVANVKSLRLSGVNEVALGPTTSFTFEAILPGKAVLDTQGGVVRTVMNGDQVFRIPAPQGPQAPAALTRKALIEPFMPIKYETAEAPREVTGIETVDGRQYYVVSANLPAIVERLFFDVETGLLRKIRSETPTPLGTKVEERVYEDYRTVNGVTLAYLVTSHYTEQQALFRISDVQINAAVDAKQFDPPPPVVRKAVTLDPAVLDTYVGTYQGAPPAPAISATFRRVGDHLTMALGANPPIDVTAESESRFYSQSSSVQWTFVKDDKGQVIGVDFVSGSTQFRLNRVK